MTEPASNNPFAPKLPKSRMALFGQVERLGFDPEGRVILTRGLMEYAGISDAAEFIGMGDTFQIWQPEAGAARRDEAAPRQDAAGRMHGRFDALLLRVVNFDLFSLHVHDNLGDYAACSTYLL